MRFIGQLGIGGREQIGVEPAVFFDGSDGIGLEAQADCLPQRIGEQRRLLYIRQEPPTRLIMGVADIIARHYTLTRYAAASGHDPSSIFAPAR